MKGLERLERKEKRLNKWLPPVKVRSQSIALTLDVPEWALPLEQKSRYKAAYGGRSGGKSHYFAEKVVRRMSADPDLRVVCIREIQKSLTFSVKALIALKIQALGVSHLFEILTTEIRRKGGRGICIFQGMQDHTAQSIKSLEGFNVAWVEEAQNLSQTSLALLRPTIRAIGSELWFGWNPEQPTDPVDQFFRSEEGPPKGATVVSVNYDQNPHITQESLDDMALDREGDTDYFNHVWLGGYNVRSQLQILAGKWRMDEFEPQKDWDGPYYGADWGFSTDPTAAVRLWLHDRCLWVEYESWAQGLELDETAKRWIQDIPEIAKHTVRADSSRPDTISHVKRGDRDRPSIPGLAPAEKWAGSVEAGIEYLRNFKAIVVHQRCKRFIDECRLYSYKANAAGDPLRTIVDKHNHLIDSTRYALAPLIRNHKTQQAAPTPKPASVNAGTLRKIF
jgi:phage terminase large subunit